MTVFTAKYIGCFDETENGGNVTLAAAGPDLTPVTCLGRCNTPFAQLAPWNATAVACTCMPQFEIKKVPTEQCFLLCKDKIHYCGGFSPDHTRLWSMYEKIPMPSVTEKAAKTTTKCAFCYSGGDKSTTSIVTTTNHVPPFGHFSSNLGQHSTTTTRILQLPPVTSNQPELPLYKSKTPTPPIQDPKPTTSQTNVIDIPSSTTIAIGGGEGGGVVSSLDEGDGVMRISSSPNGNPITAGPSATTVTDTPGNPRPPPPAPLPTLITPEPNNNNNQFTAPLIVVLSVVAITVFSAFTAYRRRKKSRSSDFQPSNTNYLKPLN
ncbi:hypothetical protein BCR33DRAFT_257594 [Rhizoclosmatium globosum]|uniref:WSC domain-containing protein n=1 Tax=Rhizoclosmatium globosum TaxID=329046 RepID=A0A1Y2C8E4_9FUNG|nr:hypothetical protein BCR33DRAFT_257594 [Rhizoclosmatium globosum]|eukprot:ORY43298.1 hypothetical protein BCR33DRAFT_257594 [Rhizoclosmatium globosum]